MTRLLFVGGVAAPSGAEIALLRLVEGLRGRAHVTVVLLEHGPMVARYRSAGAVVEVLPLGRSAISAGRHIDLRGLLSLRDYGLVLLRLVRLLRRVRPDLVVGNTLRGSALAGPAARMAHVPFVWLARDRLSADYIGGVSRLVFRGLLRGTAGSVIANSATTAASLPRHRRTFVLHDPLPGDYLADRPARSSGVATIGVVGRLAAWKGHALFLRAFANAFREGTARARIVGGPAGSDPVSIAELVGLAAALGVEDRVDVVGHVDDVRRELDDIDVLVHCSLIPEPFGQVVAEGLARGCLVVVPDQGGPSELVVEGRNGLTYAMGSEQELSRRLRDVAEMSPDHRTDLREAGRQSVRKLAADEVATEFLRLVTPLARSRARA